MGLRERKRHEEREVDLAALVDIMANMIFFLMATVTFLSLRTVNAAVPALSTGAVDTGRGVDVSIEVTAEGYVLKASGEASDTSAGKIAVDEKIERRANGALDTRELTKRLWELKKKTPETKNVMIFPEDEVPFEEIVQTMDASREMPSILDPTKRVPLFTRPVLSELVKGDETPRDDVPAPGGEP